MNQPNYLIAGLLILFLAGGCKEKTNSNTTTEPEEIPGKIAQLEYQIEAQLGEGAFWNHQTDEFWWVDILGKQLHVYNPQSKDNRSYPTPSRIGTVVPQTDSTAVVALDDGIYLMNLNNGEVSILSDVEQDAVWNRFNDGKCDPLGNLWVGSMHLEEKEALGSVYKIDALGQTQKMIDSVTISNGIVWTKDGSTMYYIDTPTASIRAYDFDMQTASISNERIAVSVDSALGFPDGMAIDAEDKLWVGLWNGNAVARFDPLDGSLMETIAVPEAHNVTACAFGGPDLDLLYITTARVDMSEAELEQKPLSGSIFVADPGVKGVPSTLFAQPNSTLE